MRPLLTLFAVLSMLAGLPFAAHSATPDSTKIPSGEITEYGICEQRHVSERYSQPQSTAGYATIGALRITQTTDDIPLRKDIGFGFRWKARNLPDQAVVTYRIEHPPITRPDGKTLTSFEEPMTQEAKLGVVDTADCYFLSEDHELVPGTWTLSILHKGTLLVKRSFHVKRPQ